MNGMPTPTPVTLRDGTVRWRVQFREGGRGSKLTSRRFADEAGADAFARLIDQLGVTAAVEVLDARTARQAEMSAPWTVESWCNEYIDTLSGVEDGTRGRYRSYVRRDLGALGPLPLDAVDDAAIRKWVNSMSKNGASGKTVKNKHGFLSGAFAAAVAKKLTAENPCAGTRLPRTEQSEMVFLTHSEYAQFIGFFVPRWQPIVATLFQTGLRWGEVTALRPGDIDLSAGQLRVSRAWKESDSGPPKIGPPKTPRSRRTIALAPETIDILTPLVKARKADEYVFLNGRGDPVRGSSFHEGAWQPAVRLANGKRDNPERRRRRSSTGRFIEPAKNPLGKHPRVHDTRHTCASWMLGAGVPITTVQYFLGHESITTTVDRYGHLMPGAGDLAAAAISQAVTGAHPRLEPEVRQIGAAAQVSTAGVGSASPRWPHRSPAFDGDASLDVLGEEPR